MLHLCGVLYKRLLLCGNMLQGFLDSLMLHWTISSMERTLLLCVNWLSRWFTLGKERRETRLLMERCWEHFIGCGNTSHQRFVVHLHTLCSMCTILLVHHDSCSHVYVASHASQEYNNKAEGWVEYCIPRVRINLLSNTAAYNICLFCGIFHSWTWFVASHRSILLPHMHCSILLSSCNSHSYSYTYSSIVYVHSNHGNS